jgi:hypothetical protein
VLLGLTFWYVNALKEVKHWANIEQEKS